MSKQNVSAEALETINERLSAIAGLVNRAPDAPLSGAEGCQVGVDLGTADIQTIAIAPDGEPIAAMLEWADVVRDGVVVDYARACSVVREQLGAMQEWLGCDISEVVTSFPPGTDARLSTHVVESAGVQVKYVIDEPSSVATLLNIANGAVVDIGGGTTGTAIVRNGQIVASLDDATGGRHLDLALAGHLGIAVEEAELHKRDCQDQSVADILRPVIQKMADVVRMHIQGHEVPRIYLSGGSCALPGFLDCFASEFPEREVVLPAFPLYLTPLAIASYSPDVAVAAQPVAS